MPLYGEAKREYQRKWVANRRAEWFKDKVCRNCGTNDSLELNHVDPSTKVTHAVWSWSKERRDEELAKCEPLCSPCHLEVTKKQLSRPINHGTKSGYNRGCRKPCCMEGMRVWFRNYRNRS